MDTNEVVVEKKLDEFHVHLKDRQGVRGQGNTVLTAVGVMVCDHPEAFGLKMNYAAGDSLSPCKS